MDDILTVRPKFRRFQRKVCHTNLAMTFYIEGLTEIKVLARDSLRFNVLFKQEDFYLAVPGFRWVNGNILPPYTRSRNTWYPVMYSSQWTAESIYDALKDILENKDMSVKFPLNSKETACQEMIDKVKVSRFFPDLVIGQI